MWDLIDKVCGAFFEYKGIYKRDPDAFAIGCLMKAGAAVLTMLAVLCWTSDIHFMAWFFGIPAVILVIIIIKFDWDCVQKG